MSVPHIDESSGWEEELIRPTMRSLPPWVKKEYLTYLWETLGPDGELRDDAAISTSDRLKFYETILGNVTSAPVWTALEQHRWLVSAHFAQGRAEWSDEEPQINQVADLLQAAHMAHRGHTRLEAMTRSHRKTLGDAISISARKLASELETVWLASSPDEREYPFVCPLPHEELQVLLSRIAEGADIWVQRAPVLQRPGRGDAARRYFIISMADWFEEFYSAEMEDGTRLSKRLDNVTTALVNCLYPEGVLDQSTVAKVINGAKGKKSLA
ncbi:hypothetical protein ACW5F0_09175 [Luteimonas sp. A534]